MSVHATGFPEESAGAPVIDPTLLQLVSSTQATSVTQPAKSSLIRIIASSRKIY
jgi:hypothetical protein